MDEAVDRLDRQRGRPRQRDRRRSQGGRRFPSAVKPCSTRIAPPVPPVATEKVSVPAQPALTAADAVDRAVRRCDLAGGPDPRPHAIVQEGASRRPGRGRAAAAPVRAQQRPGGRGRALARYRHGDGGRAYRPGDAGFAARIQAELHRQPENCQCRCRRFRRPSNPRSRR